MGRFAAAKANSTDVAALQRAINYLCDLLDQGYSTRAKIGTTDVEIKINPQVGVAFYEGDDYRGGIEQVDGDVALVSDVIKSPTFANTFIKFEPETAGGVEYQVLNFYVKDSDAGTPYKHITIKGFANTTDNYTALETHTEKDANAIEITAYEGVGDAKFASLVIAPTASGTGIRMSTDAGHTIGIDDTGPYYIKSGGAQVYW